MSSGAGLYHLRGLAGVCQQGADGAQLWPDELALDGAGYGGRAAFLIVSTMFLSIVLAGISVDLLFASLNLIPTGPRPQDAISMARFEWNYTTWLNFAAIAWAGWLIFLYRKSPRAAGAPASAEHLPEHHH